MTRETAYALLQDVLDEYPVTTDRWANAPFERIRRIQTASRGKIGQQLVARLCDNLALDYELGKTQSPWDIRIERRTYEIKTATEGDNLTFQFNHIRYHRPYDFLLCVGITPCDIVFDAWTKADIVTGKAGRLVTMEKGANASFKLTKRASEMKPVEQFEDHILALTKRGST